MNSSGESEKRLREGLCDSWVRKVTLFFFFQAEDGIRDIGVTGVQTCALPISGLAALCDWLVSLAGHPGTVAVAIEVPHGPVVDALLDRGFAVHAINPKRLDRLQIGRASCRERGEISVVAVSLKKKQCKWNWCT